jgi:small subunit ribosomal protein S8
MPSIFNNTGNAIISTSQGVMTDREARKEKIGGEFVCKVW